MGSIIYGTGSIHIGNPQCYGRFIIVVRTWGHEADLHTKCSVLVSIHSVKRTTKAQPQTNRAVRDLHVIDQGLALWSWICHFDLKSCINTSLVCEPVLPGSVTGIPCSMGLLCKHFNQVSRNWTEPSLLFQLPIGPSLFLIGFGGSGTFSIRRWLQVNSSTTPCCCFFGLFGILDLHWFWVVWMAGFVGQKKRDRYLGNKTTIEFQEFWKKKRSPTTRGLSR